MIINTIDELFDVILNNFYDFLYKKDILKKFTKDPNFVKFQEEILKIIYEFIKTIPSNDILKIIKKNIFLDNIINIIKRYCAFYIYLGIGYYYNEGRDLFITNIIETSKNQKDSMYQITNFYNSDNNSKIINFYNEIQNIKSLMEFKSIDKIKIIISNNPIKFEGTMKLFNELGEDYVINNFLIKDNFQNIIKTIIFKQIYLKEEKHEINQYLNEIDKIEGEYKYIEIIVPNSKKIVDFNIIQKLLNVQQLRKGIAEEIYNYLTEFQENKEIIVNENQDFINYLFSNKIIIPMTEDFLRYHKDTEKYESDTEKIKYIITKMNTIINKYPKIDIDKYFYKNLDPRLAILYNDNEEIKIIQKLMISDNTADSDSLIELQNLRKYAYGNFKNSNNTVIKLRTSNTIDAIRLINLKKKKKELLETRIGHNYIDLNVVGIVFNPTRLKKIKPLDCYTVQDLINVNDVTKKNNGFLSFIKILDSSLNKNKLYYWLFNNETDIPKLNKYIDYNKNDPTNNFNIMLSEIYNKWINIIKNKFIKYLNSIENINLIQLEYLINVYEKKYFNLNFNPEIKNFILNKALTEKFKESEIEEDLTDNLIPGIRATIIKLPSIKIDKNKKNIIIIDKNIKDIEETDIIETRAICNHYIKWANLSNISKSDNKDLNQMVFEFVKKYVKQNEKGDYICKSCNEMLALTKYVKEGSYNKETDEFMTTSLAVNQQLYDMPKYATLNRTIKNLEKNIEKIAYIADILYYLGNSATIKMHRKTIVKDTIDLILLHTNYIKLQPKDRTEKAVQNYNINKDLTNLFFFELKDDIFLTSSTDTDYYKLIKFNNVIAYLILIIITELNASQILNLKNDKRCNYFFYSQFGDIIFKNLYLRLNEKDKILITQIPLFAYCIYYFSCLLTSNKIWLWTDTSDPKIKNDFNITIQKIIIHTLIDLINSIIEANLEKNKNYMYEILVARFLDKIKTTFNDKEILKKLNNNMNNNIKFDEKTNRISFLTKKINYISIDKDNKDNKDDKDNFDFNYTKNYCNVKTKIINKVKFKKDVNIINSLTNCEDGNFHKWIFVDGTMICSLCKKKYSDLVNENNTTESTEMNVNYFDKLKFTFIKKLTKKYCLDGKLHQINITDGICNLCNINPDTYKYTITELNKLDKILNDKENNQIQQNYDILKEKEKQVADTQTLNRKIIGKFNKHFVNDIIDKYSSNKLENYIIVFIDKLISILGNKIKIKNKTTYLKDTLYIIDHNYLGNDTKTNINILSSDGLILTFNNHQAFNKDILYYKDKINKVYVYYDIVTLQYLGYSEDNKNIKKNKNNATIKIEYSIKDCLLLLGLENTYTNLYHIDSTLINHFNPNLNTIINQILRTRIINLKQIISRAQSIINSVRNHGKNTNSYNLKEKTIINEFITKLHIFNLKNTENEKGVFKNSKYINNLINLKQIYGEQNYPLNTNYFNNNILNNASNSDTKLIYYLIVNFNRLLDYNKQPAIETELAYFIIRIIEYSFELYFKENNYSEIRKFDYIILCDEPYIDENIRINDDNEIVVKNEVEEELTKERNYDAKEAADSLDIDDYDAGDDMEDGYMEALGGDNDT